MNTYILVLKRSPYRASKYTLFENCVSSPLCLVPKGNTRKFRVIHDLSFFMDQSVNTNIPEENSTIQYDSIDNIVHLMQIFEHDCLIAMHSATYLFIHLALLCLCSDHNNFACPTFSQTIPFFVSQKRRDNVKQTITMC